MGSALAAGSASVGSLSDGVANATSKAASLTLADTTGAMLNAGSKLKECTGAGLSTAAQAQEMAQRYNGGEYASYDA